MILKFLVVVLFLSRLETFVRLKTVVGVMASALLVVGITAGVAPPRATAQGAAASGLRASVSSGGQVIAPARGSLPAGQLPCPSQGGRTAAPNASCSSSHYLESVPVAVAGGGSDCRPRPAVLAGTTGKPCAIRPARAVSGQSRTGARVRTAVKSAAPRQTPAKRAVASRRYGAAATAAEETRSIGTSSVAHTLPFHADSPPWTVTLTYTVDTSIHLTATASAELGGRYLAIWDQTSGGDPLVQCSTGTTCTLSTIPKQAQDTYIATIGSYGVYYPPSTLLATSSPVTPPGWSVTLSATVTSTIQLTATSNYGLSNSNLIEIFDTTVPSSQYLTWCNSGTTCSVTTVPKTVQSSYRAVVIPGLYDTYPPSNVVRATSNTVTPPAWNVTLSATVTSTIQLTATSNYGLSNSNIIEIFDTAAPNSNYLTWCNTGTTCSLSTVPAESQSSYRAVVVPGLYDTYPPTSVSKAASNTVTPPPWRIRLDATTAGSGATLTATANYQMGRYIEIFDLNSNATTTYLTWCGSGSQCSTTVGASSHQFVATVGSLSNTFPPGPNPLLAVSNTVGEPQFAPTSAFETSGGSNQSARDCHCHAADPVDTATGEFDETYTDLAVPGRGPALALTRTYGSQRAPYDGPFGYGWSFSYGLYLAQDTPGSTVVSVHQEGGSVVAFTPDGSGGYTGSSHLFATLTHNDDGSWTFVRRARQTFDFNAAGQLTHIKDPNGYTTVLTYNAAGQLSTVTDPAGRAITIAYNSQARIDNITDPAGRVVYYGYDTAGRLTSVTDPAGAITHFGYDASNLLTSATDADGAHTINTYDVGQRVTGQQDPDGNTTTFGYATGGVTTITSPAGRVTTHTYSNGELLSETRGAGTAQAATWTYTYDPATLGVTSVTDPNNHTRRATYNLAGNQLTDTDPLGNTQSSTYDSLGDITSVTDRSGTTTTNTYDTAGNPLTTSRPLTGSGQNQTATLGYTDPAHPGDVTTIVDPLGHTTARTYDIYGDLASSTDPAGDSTHYNYNILGQLTSRQDPRGHSTTYEYDPDGRPIKVTDPAGHSTSTSYDIAGRPLSSTDAVNHTTAFSYDADGRLTETTRPDTSTQLYGYDVDGNQTSYTDPNGHTTTNSYDPQRRLSSTTDPMSRTTTYGYDPVGNRTTLSSPDNLTTTYGYDAADRQTTINYSDGATPNVTYSYDNAGRRLTMTDGSGTTSYTYDSLDRITRIVDGHGTTTDYGFDLAGNKTSISYPGTGHTVSKTYDAAQRLSTVSDWLGNTSTFGYDANSNLITTTLPSATAETDTSSYDLNNQIISITDSKTVGGNPATLAGFSYTRDGSGRLTSETTTGVSTPDQTYTYNNLNQLTASGSTDTPTTYGYNPGNNITNRGTTSGGTASTLVYNAADQACWSSPSTISNPTCGSPSTDATTYTYDSRGNRTSSTAPSSSYTYNQANQLVAASTPTGTGSYTYNGDGLRAIKTVSTTTTHFTWDQTVSVPQLLADDTNYYINGPANQALEQINTATGIVTWLHHDQIGSTRLLTDDTGNSVGTNTYDVYGSRTSTTGTVTSQLGFASQYTDTETGLIYLRARYYDPATAQFLSVDPAVAATQEAYAYVGGDPLNQTDPTGLCFALGCVSSAAKFVGHTLGDAASDTGNFIYEHRKGIAIGVGIGLGVLAAGTGVGAIIAGPTLVGVGLGLFSAGAGIGAAAFDYGPCVHKHEAAACGGLGLGLTGAFVGLTGVVGAGAVVTGLITEDSVLWASLSGVGALGWNLGLAGTAIDVGESIGKCGSK
jgi:RHS repeat-associated protein